MPEFRVGIIGAGRMAGQPGEREFAAFPGTHAAAIAEGRSFEIAAVHDTDPDQARRFASRWGGQIYPDAPAMLAGARLDVAVIATPDDTHAGLTATGLSSSCCPAVLIVEKPPCTRRAELGGLRALAEARPATIVVVNLSRRFDRGHLDLSRDVAAGRFGRLVEATCEYSGGWVHSGPHVVDTLRLLTGGELRVDRAAVGAFGRPGDPCLDVDLTSLPSGAAVTVRGADERRRPVFDIALRFPAATVRVTEFGQRIVVDPAGPSVSRTGDAILPTQALYGACSRYLLDGDRTALCAARLEAVAPSMALLFDAQEQAGTVDVAGAPVAAGVGASVGGVAS
ncbi:MAG: Gfo/Idh/MocA family oxidoreductase [Acidimicrobiia bacterium]|nr:Gfo/Idh/MocA family oxidoreductase [Acidimicrobiia bacterium]